MADDLLTSLPTVNAVLAAHAAALGTTPSYRHHVPYRVVHLCVALSSNPALPLDQLEVAAVFRPRHLDRRHVRLPQPSVALAAAHLARHGRQAQIPAVTSMILEHHKVTAYRGPNAPLVEAFRRADWVDVTRGLLTFGLPRAGIDRIRRRWPDAGFHRRLLQLSAARLVRLPISPLPMLRLGRQGMLRGVLARLLARVGLVTPEQRAWAWYDCGNSAYFTTVITAVFPAFFASYAASGMSPTEATTRFGLITTVAMAIVAVASPILGAYGDFTARRKKLLVLFAGLGVLATFLLTTISEGGWQWAAIIFILSTRVWLARVLRLAAAERGENRRDRPGVVGRSALGPRRRRALVVNLAWILSPATFGLPSTVAATKLSFASVGVWWLLFMIPLLRHVPEPPRLVEPTEAEGASPLAATFSRLGRTFSEIRQYRQAFLALLAMLVYQDGIQTIIRFAGIYGAEVGVGQSQQIAAFAMVQLLGVPFAFIFGGLGAKMGTKRAIFLALGVYAVAATLGYFMTNAVHFFILAASSPRCRAARRRSAARSSRGSSAGEDLQ
jgi:UMF1 family MFS transporter